MNFTRVFPFFSRPVPAGHLAFVCNICGARTSAKLTRILDRESSTCSNCGSKIRFRALIAALQQRRFNLIEPLSQSPKRKDLKGLGMSDDETYSTLLEEKFSYTNTFFHTEPCLDISNPSPDYLGRFDFVICADVMEHVPPPVEVAFKNVRSLLRDGGLLVLTVPFTGEQETVEHFPELHHFQILGDKNNHYLLNVTREGKEQRYNNLTFHGGKGATLEMRIFSRAGVLSLLENSGFREIQIHSESLPEWGIVHPHPFSVPITALAG